MKFVPLDQLRLLTVDQLLGICHQFRSAHPDSEHRQWLIPPETSPLFHKDHTYWVGLNHSRDESCAYLYVSRRADLVDSVFLDEQRLAYFTRELAVHYPSVVVDKPPAAAAHRIMIGTDCELELFVLMVVIHQILVGVT